MPAPRYNAFLSYSHRDTRLAWLIHWRLERFRIPQALRGRPSPIGPIPDRLHPIFLDRFHFSAGRSLTDQTMEALKDSAALILLGSPNAARSVPVNLEVQIFHGHNPNQPIAPLILSGSTTDPDNPCFPPALLDILGANPVIADWHKDGDRGATALAKIVAQLLGVAPIDIRDHFKAQQRRERSAWAATGALIVVLGAGAGYASIEVLRTEHKAKLDILMEKRNGMSETAKRMDAEVRQVQTADILKVTELSYRATDEQRRLAEGTALVAQKAASSLISSIAQILRSFVELPATSVGRILDACMVTLDNMLREHTEHPILLRLKSITLSEFAETYRSMGDSERQSTAATQSAEIAKKLADSALGDNEAQRDLSVSYNRVGDAQVSQGNLPDALRSYRDGLSIAERLAKADPANESWQRDLSVSYNKVGDAQVSQGNLPDALRSYRDGLAIAERLAKSDPTNAGWQRDLSVSYSKVGDVQVRQGNLPDALRSYRDGLAIAERLAKSDPTNAGWQRDLSVSYDRGGNVQVSQGSLPDALRSYRDGLAIRERLAKADPNNADWQRDLSVSYSNVADVLVSQGNLPDALRSYRDGLSIAERLAKLDPNNAEWQRDLSVSYTKIGDVQESQGTLPDALRSYRDGLSIAERLAKADPNNAGWQRDLSVSYNKVGDVQVRQGSLPDALRSYRDGLSIAERLAKSDPNNAGWQRDLSISYGRLASAYRADRQLPQARQNLTAGRAIIADLVAKFPDWAAWKRDLAWFDAQIAAVGP